MELRPYQAEAKAAVFEQWDKGAFKTLLYCRPAAERPSCLQKSQKTVCVKDTGY